MSKYGKAYTRRRQEQARRWGETVILIGVGIVGAVLLTLTYWHLFLWCLIAAGILAGSFLVYKITELVMGKAAVIPQTEVVQDSRYISPQLRQAVWARCQGRCVECQNVNLLEYDHIIPLSKGGATSYENLQILCRACNRHKSAHI